MGKRTNFSGCIHRYWCTQYMVSVSIATPENYSRFAPKIYFQPKTDAFGEKDGRSAPFRALIRQRIYRKNCSPVSTSHKHLYLAFWERKFVFSNRHYCWQVVQCWWWRMDLIKACSKKSTHVKRAYFYLEMSWKFSVSFVHWLTVQSPPRDDSGVNIKGERCRHPLPPPFTAGTPFYTAHTLNCTANSNTFQLMVFLQSVSQKRSSSAKYSFVSSIARAKKTSARLSSFLDLKFFDRRCTKGIVSIENFKKSSRRSERHPLRVLYSRTAVFFAAVISFRVGCWVLDNICQF